MHAVRLHRVSPENPPSLSSARIGSPLEEEGCFRLDDGRLARQALSCVIAPAAGDRVLILDGEESFILHVLARPQLDAALLAVPGAGSLAIRQKRIELSATEHAAMRSLRDLELTAAGGTLALNARNLFTTVAESLIENVRDYVGRFAQHLMEAKGLVRMHSGQALMTAEKEFRVDGERISLG